MHSDMITFKKNRNRHIWDMMYKIKDDRDWKIAYGPAFTKLYARVEESYEGGWVTQNGKLNASWLAHY